MKTTHLIQDFIDFLDASPTAWHAVATMRDRLLKEGFTELSEKNQWNIEPAKRYFVTRNGSSLCAFITPKTLPKQLRLLASHTDSPGFKLKPNPEIRKHGAILLGVEVYGSPLLTSWLNRDLGIAGKVIYYDRNKEIKESLVRLDEFPVIIPQLAIHLDREVNDKGLALNKQEHLNALAGLESSLKENSSYFESILRKAIDFEQIIAHDLFLYPLDKGRLAGYDNRLLSSYRIDSLSSVHAALTALIANPTPLNDQMKMTIFWDNEEVGSHTAQGADSPFFKETIERILHYYQATKEDYFRLIHRSTCISIDLAHALHPNYPDKHDPLHRPMLGQGVVIKNNAQQRYATSASSSFPIKVIANLKKISLQTFVSRNDVGCGSTIGPLQATLAGMATIDIGSGQLSMHSCRELMACQDHLDMCNLLEALLDKDEWPEIKN